MQKGEYKKKKNAKVYAEVKNVDRDDPVTLFDSPMVKIRTQHIRSRDLRPENKMVDRPRESTK